MFFSVGAAIESEGPAAGATGPLHGTSGRYAMGRTFAA